MNLQATIKIDAIFLSVEAGGVHSCTQTQVLPVLSNLLREGVVK